MVDIIILKDRGLKLVGPFPKLLFEIIRMYTHIETLSIPPINLPTRIIGVAEKKGNKIIIDSNELKVEITLSPAIKYKIVDKSSGQVDETVVQEAFEYV